MAVRVNAREGCDWRTVDQITAGLMLPAPKEKIMEWLTVLAVRTAHKKEGAQVSELKMSVYAQDLLCYPGDVVAHSLEKIGNTEDWFPTWPKLRRMIISEMGNRAEICERITQHVTNDDDSHPRLVKGNHTRALEKQADALGIERPTIEGGKA